LTIYFWDGNLWQALETVRSTQYNLVSARSQGPGVYALLAGVTRPELTSLSPTEATNDVTTTLTLHGSQFVPPVDVELAGEIATYTFTAGTVSTDTITVTIPAGLPEGEYRVRAVNRGNGASDASLPFAIYRRIRRVSTTSSAAERGSGR